jgi:NAD(P)H-hydrate epimerase
MQKLTKKLIKSILKPRDANSHKGDYGHSLLIVGSEGKMGAAVIAARACLRTGTGLLTISVPKDEKVILQIAIPEAMVAIRENKGLHLSSFMAIGIGSGIGLSDDVSQILNFVMTEYKNPIVIDADALNIISVNKNLLEKIPINSIITPHPKEFDRLFGTHENTDDRINTAIKMAKKYNIVLVLKGANTLVTHNGESFINTTGNAGLAKGGSGDALTGMLTALLSQGYAPIDASKIGVYLHGLAADLALEKQSTESMLTTDVIEYLGAAFKKILGE